MESVNLNVSNLQSGIVQGQPSKVPFPHSQTFSVLDVGGVLKNAEVLRAIKKCNPLVPGVHYSTKQLEGCGVSQAASKVS